MIVARSASHQRFGHGIVRSLPSCLLATALAASGAAQGGPIDVTVMTQNLYFGTVLEPVIAAPDLASLVAQAGVAFTAVADSRPAERMDRVADEIARAHPHVVGLQEAVLWRSKSPSQFAGGTPGPATDVEFDFVGSLLAGLSARGQSYAAIPIATGLDAQVPALFPVGIPGVVPPGLSDIRFTDRDVILVRTDLPASEFKVLGSGTGIYAARYPFAVAGNALEAIEAYAYVDIEMSGARFRAVTTHLEPIVGAVQVAQGNELIDFLDASPYRQLAFGDFNSSADGSGTATYANMLAAGFDDGWRDLGLGDGSSCCQASDLLNPASALDERIDYIFHSGGFSTLSAELVGDEAADRTASGRWPSDHAGILATLRLVPEPGVLSLLAIGIVAMVVRRPRPEALRRSDA